MGEDQLITETAARTRAAIDAGEQAIAASVIYAGIVADGIPVHPQTLRLALAAKTNPERLFVVPNAMAVAGSSITGFTLNGQELGRKDA